MYKQLTNFLDIEVLFEGIIAVNFPMEEQTITCFKPVVSTKDVFRYNF